MLHINLSHIKSNVVALKSLTNPGTQFMAVVKNNAYGHGLIEVSRAVIAGGADWLGVVHVWEGVKLRQAGITVPILVLGWVDIEEMEDAMRYGIDVPVMSLIHAQEILSYLSLRGGAKRRRGNLFYETWNMKHGTKARELRKLRVHLKIETGLNRFGSKDRELEQIVEILSKSPLIEIRGIYSHLAAVEEAKIDYARQQLERFNRGAQHINVILSAAKDLRDSSLDIHRDQNDRSGQFANKLIRHLAATSATILMPETHLDMVRCGIGIYGLWPSEETRVTAVKTFLSLRGSDSDRGNLDSESGIQNLESGENNPNSSPQIPASSFTLKPALEWREPIVACKKVSAGEAVGYGCAWVPFRDSIIGLLPIGYADGLDRSLSGKGKTIVNNTVCDIVGRICTNVTFIDMTKVTRLQNLPEAVLFSSDINSPASIDAQAKRASTINYELITRLPERLPRRYHG